MKPDALVSKFLEFFSKLVYFSSSLSPHHHLDKNSVLVQGINISPKSELIKSHFHPPSQKSKKRSRRRGQRTIKNSNNFSKNSQELIRENCKLGENCSNVWPIYFTITLISTLIYVNSLWGELVHDDLSAIKTNPDVGQGADFKNIFTNDFWGKSMGDPNSHKSYRPLTIITFRMNAIIHGMDPFGYHFVNVFLHTITSLLFLYLCLNIAKIGKLGSIFASVHFSSHPIHTEAVSGIVGRADVLAAIFLLLSFLSYDKCLRGQNLKLLFISIIFSFTSLLSKEHGITVLGINFLWDIFHHRAIIKNFHSNREMNNNIRNLRTRILTLGSCGVIFLIFRLFILQGSFPLFSDQDNPASFHPSFLTRFRTFSYLPTFNFFLLLFPNALSYDWQMGSVPLVTSWFDMRNFFTLLFYVYLFWMTFGALKEKRKRKEVVLGILFLTIPFIPASNLIFRVGFVVAERILYIPSMGFSLLFGVGGRKLCSKLDEKFCKKLNTAKFLPLVFLLLLFSFKTCLRNNEWRARESLFTSGLKTLPQNAKMHYNFANLQKDLGNISLAVFHYKEALRLWPNHASANNNLGTLLNDSSEAESCFLKALQINPSHAHAYFNLANLKYQQGFSKISIELMEKSIELEPTNLDALTNLAAMYADGGNISKAKYIHLRILNLEPDNPDHLNNYGAFLQKIGSYEESLEFYKEALLMNANHTVALLNTGRLLKKLRLYYKAETIYKRALLKNKDPQIKDGLGVFYLHTNRPVEAEKLFSEALQQKPNDVIFRVHLAQAQVQLKKYSEAELSLSFLMRKESENGESANFLISSEQSPSGFFISSENEQRRETFHQLSILHTQLNKTFDAYETIKIAINTCSADELSCAPIYALHGDILKDLGNINEAINSYLLAAEMIQHSNEILFSEIILTRVYLNLGAIYHAEGKFREAWAFYYSALEHDPKNSILLQNMVKLKRAEELYYNNSQNTTSLYRNFNNFPSTCFYPHQRNLAYKNYNVKYPCHFFMSLK